MAHERGELTPSMRRILTEVHGEMMELEQRIAAMNQEIEGIAACSDIARRLMTVPGVGPLASTALLAAAGSGRQFRKARDLAAWLGLVPREHSTGGKTKLLGISKRGNKYLRRMIVHGARSCVTHLDRSRDRRAWRKIRGSRHLSHGRTKRYTSRMFDTLSPSARSERMSRVRAQDTKPEMLVRRIVYAMGYRYRLHDKRLPGKPDLVFRSRRKIIFVHGCFWHRHADRDCRLARLPKSRLDFWLPKLERNAHRDVENRVALEKDGWRILELWECQVKDVERIRNEVREFLDEVD